MLPDLGAALVLLLLTIGSTAALIEGSVGNRGCEDASCSGGRQGSKARQIKKQASLNVVSQGLVRAVCCRSKF